MATYATALHAAHAKNRGDPSGARETARTIVDARSADPVTASDDERDCIGSAGSIINDLLMRGMNSFPVPLMGGATLLACASPAGARQEAGSRAEEQARQQQKKAGARPADLEVAHIIVA
jgi:hypothetical protein